MIAIREAVRDRWFSTLLLVPVLSLGLARAVAQQPVPDNLTAAQVQHLRERDLYDTEAKKRIKTGELDEALELLARALNIEKQVYGPVHLESAKTMRQIATIHIRRDDLRSARQLRSQVAEILESLYPKGDWRLVDARLELGRTDLLTGMSKEDRAQLREAMDLSDETEEFHGKEQYREAAAAAKKALAIHEEVFGPDHPETASSMDSLGTAQYALGEFRPAWTNLKAALEVRKKVLGQDHPLTASNVYKLGALAMRSFPPSAKPYFEEALRIQKRLYGFGNERTIEVQNTLGYLLTVLGDQQTAHDHFQRTLALCRSNLGTDHIETGRALQGIANSLYARGDAAGSRPYLEEALAVYRKVRGEEGQLTLGAMVNLGLLLSVIGDYHGARPHLERTLAIQRKRLGAEHPQTAHSLHGLGFLLYSIGDYAGARTYLEHALAIRKKIFGPEHRLTSEAQFSLADVLRELGDYPAAKALFEHVIADRVKRHGEQHQETATSRHGLGVLLFSIGEHEEALVQFDRALRVRDELLGDHRETAMSLMGVGQTLAVLERYVEAERQLRRYVDMTEQALGPKHIESALAMNNLAGFLRKIGKLDESKALLQRALGICEASLGPADPLCASFHGNLGLTAYACGDATAAISHLRRRIQLRLHWVDSVLTASSEAEALAYVRALKTGADPLLSVFKTSRADRAEEAYSVVWKTRGLVTRFAARHRPSGGESPEIRKLYDELGMVRKQLAELTLSSRSTRLRQSRLKKATQQKERLERELIQQNQRFRSENENDEAQFTDLIKQLPPKTALFHVVRTSFWQTTGDGQGKMKRVDHYDAFVLKKTNDDQGYSVVWEPLGPAEPIDRAVLDWRKQFQGERSKKRDLIVRPLAQNDKLKVANPGRRLRRLVWDKCSAQFADCDTVIVVPDGAVTAVPWSALPGKMPGTFLITGHAICTVSTGQQLIALLEQPKSESFQALLVGGVNYDPVKNGATQPTTANGGRFSAPIDQPKWAHLGETEKELQSIAALCEHPTILKGHSATEAAVRQRLPEARTIHLATHGFFADSSFRSAFQHDVHGERLFGTSIGGQFSTVTGRNPLILSGLVFAAANGQRPRNEWGAEVGDDGILTAEEVVGMDLTNADLVVLSACETGLGQVAGGEGVFGLQKAFHVAGARSVIASLWKVDDSATRALMTEFYQNLLRKKLGKLQSLRQAQLTMIQRYDPSEGRLRGFKVKPAEQGNVSSSRDRLSPFYWAGFVLSGDWR